MRGNHVKMRFAGIQFSRLSVILDSLLFLILSQKWSNSRKTFF